MSVEFMDSFDDNLAVIAGAPSKWDGINSGPFIDNTNPRTGPNSLRCPSPIQDALYRSVTRTPFTNEWIVGAAMFMDNIAPNSSQGTLAFGNIPLTGGTNQAHVTMENDDVGRVYITRGNGGSSTQLGITAGTPVVAAAWQYWEFRGLVDPTVGEVEARIDGVQVLLITGVNTRNGGSSDVTVYKVGLEDDTGYIDDVVVLDTATGIAPRNDFLGDVQVEALFPDADDTATINWAPTPGPPPNFQFVDEPIPSVLDYVSSGTPGDIDLYSHQPVPFVGGIVAVQSSVYWEKDASGTRIGRMRVESPGGGAGTPATGPSIGIPSTPVTETTVWQQNPAGPINWTDVTVNAAVFGPELVT